MMWVLWFPKLFGCFNLGSGSKNICNTYIFQPFYNLNISGNKNNMGIAKNWVICISIM